MSRNVPDHSHPFWIEAFYGPGGRRGGKGRAGEREGDLCIAVVYASEGDAQIELDILRDREDVGRIETGMNPW